MHPGWRNPKKLSARRKGACRTGNIDGGLLLVFGRSAEVRQGVKETIAGAASRADGQSDPSGMRYSVG